MVRKEYIFFTLLLIVLFTFSFLYISGKNLFVDEEVHYLQIKRFISGDNRVYEILTVIPGYHYFLSIIGKTFNFYTESEIRLLNAVIGLISVFIFLFTAFKIEGKNGWNKGLQYLFFPILFPFFFLIYTDVLSLLLVLLMFYFVLLKKYNLGGIFGILSFFVRQNNIIWILFALCFVYVKENGIKYNFKGFVKTFRDCKIFVFGLFLGILFFIWNKGFSFGDKEMHTSGIFFGNTFFLLFLFFFLFLPLNLSNFWKIKKFVSKNKWIWFLIILVFIIYIRFFIVNHPYNFLGKDYFLRNILLQKFISGNSIKAMLFLPIAYSILSLFVAKLKKKEFYLLYPFTILSLLPMWLIEQRYYLIPLTLFILFKDEKKGWIEKTTIGIYFVLSILILYFIGESKFFL